MNESTKNPILLQTLFRHLSRNEMERESHHEGYMRPGERLVLNTLLDIRDLLTVVLQKIEEKPY
ncbi:MAG: hypothetical protein L0Y56_11290 [Nitrospira sp.]|nr:hypothetical protein [Nitrospira sp.]